MHFVLISAHFTSISDLIQRLKYSAKESSLCFRWLYSNIGPLICEEIRVINVLIQQKFW